MLCRPLRAVMVGRRYAIILPDRSSIYCSLTKSHSEQVSDHFCFFPSLFNFIFSPRNTTRKIKSSPVGEPEEVTKCETKKKKKRWQKIFHYKTRACFIALSSTRFWRRSPLVYTLALSQTQALVRSRGTSFPIFDHNASVIKMTLSVSGFHVWTQIDDNYKSTGTVQHH